MNKAPESLTPERVKQILHYDQITGIFTWLPRPRESFKTERAFKIFNSNFSGKSAGSTCGHGYTRIDCGEWSIRAHRLAWFYVHGVWPKEIDHIDGDRKNNALENLREVNRMENSRNRCVRSDNKHGVLGVSKRISNGNERWEARISDSGGKTLTLGVFVHFADAVFARKIAEKCFGYHKNHGRAARG